jgi:hypothetical protein
MSSSIISSLTFISQQVNIYFGITILASGTLGGILNIIVFLSLQTFRRSSCAFYLTIMSIVNLGQLYTGLFTRIMITGFNIDWTQQSLVYCKLRVLIFQLCTIISFTCLCLATIDQYFATCSRPRWQQWCNIKLAQRLMIGSTVIWILHAIPYAIFFDLVASATPNKFTCITTNAIFLQYRAYVVSLVLMGCLPLIITVFFAIQAYRNMQQLSYRTVPLVRRELDKQLTKMVLAQVVLNFFTDIPFVITNALTIDPNITTDPLIWAKLQFAFLISTMFFYSYFAVSRKNNQNILNEFIFYYLESILHLHLCIRTISSAIDPCFI